jgi:hypothetical protein
LEAISYRSGCLFVAAPDVVGEATATQALFERWQPVLQSVWATIDEGDVQPGQPIHQPIALVAQDGLERLPVPWEHLQALYGPLGLAWLQRQAEIAEQLIAARAAAPPPGS